MKTVIIKEIDGFQVVTGFAERVVDPVRSQKEALEYVRKSDEFKALRSDFESIVSQVRAGKRGVQIKGDRNVLVKFNALLRDALASNIQYSPLRPGEELLDAESIENLAKKFLLLGKNEKLTLNGLVVDDFRGVTYMSDDAGVLARHSINKLGDSIPRGAIFEPTTAQVLVCNEQEELTRGARLVGEERDAWVAERTTYFKKQAAQLRSELEIEGDSNALDKARGWYQAQLKKLEV
jgi:hypothetical protein